MQAIQILWLVMWGLWPAAMMSQMVPDSYALVGVHLVLVDQEKIDSSKTVLITNGKIEAIFDADTTIEDRYKIIKLDDAFLLPGMIDVHTHLSSFTSAKIALHSGVTTIRTAGVEGYQDVTMSKLVKEGYLAGPDVVPAGVYVTPHLGETALADPRFGPLMEGVENVENLRLMVRINADRGAKVIKTRGTERAGRPETDPRKQTYSRLELEAVVEEANKYNLPVMIHAHGDEGSRAAVLAGARSIEHGTFLTETTLKLMAARGTFLVPTFITLIDLVEPGGDYDQPVVNMRGRYMIPKSEAMIRKAMELGVKIATGADNRYLEKSLSRVSMEAMHFVRLGMTPWEALKTVSINGAELLEISDQTGRIAIGVEADLIAVLDNPVDDIKTLQDVVVVISNGYEVINRLPFGKD